MAHTCRTGIVTSKNIHYNLASADGSAGMLANCLLKGVTARRAEGEQMSTMLCGLSGDLAAQAHERGIVSL